MPVKCQRPKAEEMNLQTFLTANWESLGSFINYGSPWDKSREQMHRDTSASHLTQPLISGTKPMRTSGKNRKLSVVRIGSFSPKMCAKYVPRLQVQFGPESLISVP